MRESSRHVWSFLKGSWTDRMLLLLALMMIAYGWQWLQQHLQQGEAMVFIYHDETLLAKYPLLSANPVHFTARGSLGDAEIVIEQGKVRMLSAPCSTQYCVRSGARHQHGDILACVPNHILVSIRGDTAQQFDAVVE